MNRLSELLDVIEDFLMATIFRHEIGIWLVLIICLAILPVSLIIRLNSQ